MPSPDRSQSGDVPVPISRHLASAKVPGGRKLQTGQRKLPSPHARALVQREQMVPRMPCQSRDRLGPPGAQRCLAQGCVWLRDVPRQEQEFVFPRAVALRQGWTAARHPWKSPLPPAHAKPSRPSECRSPAFDLDERCPHRKSVAAESNFVALFWKETYGKKNASILARGG